MSDAPLTRAAPKRALHCTALVHTTRPGEHVTLIQSCPRYVPTNHLNRLGELCARRGGARVVAAGRRGPRELWDACVIPGESGGCVGLACEPAGDDGVLVREAVAEVGHHRGVADALREVEVELAALRGVMLIPGKGSRLTLRFPRFNLSQVGVNPPG